MAYIKTVPPEDADGLLAEMYEQDMAGVGYAPNYTRAMSLRPDMIQAWRSLNSTLKSGMDLRLYELATFAAAVAMKSSYCSLAHGNILRSRFFSDEQVARIAQDYRQAGLESAEVALMAYAEKITLDASSVTQEDIDGLKSCGYSDEEILSIALAATARCFFSKTLDAVGAEPDASYMEMDNDLRQALTVGRPIAHQSEE
jgi:uncharacterized peroxidase-related enzyme